MIKVVHSYSLSIVVIIIRASSNNNSIIVMIKVVYSYSNSIPVMKQFQYKVVIIQKLIGKI